MHIAEWFLTLYVLTILKSGLPKSQYTYVATIDPLDQGCTTQIWCWAKKKIYQWPMAELLCVWPFKWCIYQEKQLKAQNFGLGGPHLARGPYVVHAWSRALT